ncbi:hypothetical protein B7R54_14490 [Subtercola boreus]|uniref:Uncharacterized protein n=1 Tax=Subtercola boreus TaxID=120213 RepID=A0A3E0VJZ0_9MICO|nr:hypothetical protein [Subtercola boreus]RFA10282.1 hypothetical protein B7R54_14490 [Subtercola boreus]TQL52534.1 hypothetical protein FB464_0016 [Subtercola boreus]
MVPTSKSKSRTRQVIGGAFLAVFGIFIVVRIGLLFKADSVESLDESQGAFVLVTTVAISGVIFAVVIGVFAVIGHRANDRRARVISERPDALVFTSDVRPGLRQALSELGSSPPLLLVFYLVRADREGVHLGWGYGKRSDYVSIPWSHITHISRVQIMAGVRPLSRIVFTIETDQGRVVLPVAVNKTGSSVYNFEGARVVEDYIARIKELSTRSS